MGRIDKIIGAAKTVLAKRHKRSVQKWLVERALNRTSQLPPSVNILSNSELINIHNRWGRYPTKAEPFHQFYKAATGRFDADNIPDDIHIQYIDRFYNNWPLALAIDNKTTYDIWFGDIPQPKLVVSRRNGFWYDAGRSLISETEAMQRIFASKNVFVKQAVDSYGGKGVTHIADGNRDRNKVIATLEGIKTDLVVQQGVLQSPILSQINPSSVNTLRLVTWLRKDGSVVNLSNILRMGIGDAKVDNASSGGITVGVNEDGTLKSVAYKNTGVRYDGHPTTHVKFNDFRIPSFQRAKEMVMRKAAQMPDFRLISWDVAFDQEDNPILIEANLRDGELDFHQLNNGPLFGDYTQEMLDEVFEAITD